MFLFVNSPSLKLLDLESILRNQISVTETDRTKLNRFLCWLVGHKTVRINTFLRISCPSDYADCYLFGFCIFINIFCKGKKFHKYLLLYFFFLSVSFICRTMQSNCNNPDVNFDIHYFATAIIFRRKVITYHWKMFL